MLSSLRKAARGHDAREESVAELRSVGRGSLGTLPSEGGVPG